MRFRAACAAPLAARRMRPGLTYEGMEPLGRTPFPHPAPPGVSSTPIHLLWCERSPMRTFFLQPSQQYLQYLLPACFVDALSLKFGWHTGCLCAPQAA